MRGIGMSGILALALITAACAGTRPTGEAEPPVGPTEVQVQAEDFKFGGVPASLPAGHARFALENVGKLPHEFGLVRIQGDFTAEELIQMGPAGEAHIHDVGHAFARPGKTDTLDAELEPGRYAYACFVETDGKPHAARGMFGEFTVT
jgi:uncharacterized cupredoxin-like copper-binding protein